MKIFVLLLLPFLAAAQSGGEITFHHLNDSTIVVENEMSAEAAAWWGVDEIRTYFKYEFYQYGATKKVYHFDSEESDTLTFPNDVSTVRVIRHTNFDLINTGNIYLYSNQIEINAFDFVKDTIVSYFVQVDTVDVAPDIFVDYANVIYDYSVKVECQEDADVTVINQTGVPVFHGQGSYFDFENLASGYYQIMLHYSGGAYEIEPFVVD